MKIIIVNYRYFISGGPERYLFGIKKVLEDNGHQVIPFSVKNKQNHQTDYEKYFLNPIGEDKVYFHEYEKSSFKTVLKSFSRMYYSFEAKKKLIALIKAEKPDIIYVLYYQNKISISIFDAAKKMGVPVVHRISDFGQICSNGLFFRPIQKDVCERCLSGSKLNAVRYKCVHESYLYSAIKAGSLQFEKFKNITKKTEAFIIPSLFTLNKLKEFGFPEKKLINIPTFFNLDSIKKDITICYESYALYIGRIEPEKGIFTLVKAFQDTKMNLKIIGFSNTGYDEKMKKYLEGKNHNIQFLGKMEFSEIQHYLAKCLFTLVPSECYDNFPNAILESFAFKKCVIATNAGSLKELVMPYKTGLLFEQKNASALKEKIIELFSDEKLARELGENSYKKLTSDFSSEKHYTKLITLFNNIITKAKIKEKV